MKNKYAVAITWINTIPSGMNVALTLATNIDAISAEEAFGIAYELQTELKNTHSVFKKLVGLTDDNSEYNGD